MTLYKSYRAALEQFVERRLEWIMLWPIFIYSLVLWAEPNMFTEFRHYEHMEELFSTRTWITILFLIASFRSLSLITKLVWAWPYHAPFALIASFFGALLWGQFTLSFLQSYFEHGTTPGPLAAHSTLVMLEFLNVSYAAKGVGQLVKQETS